MMNTTDGKVHVMHSKNAFSLTLPPSPRPGIFYLFRAIFLQVYKLIVEQIDAKIPLRVQLGTL